MLYLGAEKVVELKFGVFLPFYAFRSEATNPSAHFNHVRDIALECERLGYHSVWLDDHLMLKHSSILECWTTLAALSTITKRIRLGTMASSNSFRTPALLAKMAATVDVYQEILVYHGFDAIFMRFSFMDSCWSFLP